MSTRKFRFDSFASEFANLEEQGPDAITDNDSGIDSEENQVSPLHLRLHQVQSDHFDQPLSLVVVRQKSNDSNQSPVVKRHWKKSLKDQAEPEPGLQSKKQRLMTDLPYQEEAENLCLHDLRRQSTESTVAQALLSLGMVDRKTHVSPMNANQQQIILREKPFAMQETFQKPIRLPQHPVTFPNFLFHQHKAYGTPPFTHTPLREIQVHANSDNLRPLRMGFSPPGSENQAPMSKTTTCLKQILPKKPFYCSECKKGFSTQSGYIKHDELHKSNQIQRDFSCRFCNKGYTSLSALKMHTRTHTLPCKCNICGKSFSRPWLLQGHVRTHTGEKPFSCNYCLRSFADKSNLRAHLQTHLQTKKYSCQMCHKTFSRMSLLNKHTESNCKVNLNENFQSLSAPIIRN